MRGARLRWPATARPVLPRQFSKAVCVTRTCLGPPCPQRLLRPVHRHQWCVGSDLVASAAVAVPRQTPLVTVEVEVPGCHACHMRQEHTDRVFAVPAGAEAGTHIKPHLQSLNALNGSCKTPGCPFLAECVSASGLHLKLPTSGLCNALPTVDLHLKARSTAGSLLVSAPLADGQTGPRGQMQTMMQKRGAALRPSRATGARCVRDRAGWRCFEHRSPPRSAP